MLQTAVEVVHDMLAAVNALLYLFFRTGQKLGGHHHVVATGHVAEGAAYEALRGAKLIGNGGVEEVYAEVERAAYYFAGRLFTDGPRMLADAGIAEAHAAKANARHAEV